MRQCMQRSGKLLIFDLFKPHDMVLAAGCYRNPTRPWRTKSCMTPGILGRDQVHHIANSAIAHNLRDLFEIRMIFADAMIAEVFGLDDTISDDELLGVAVSNALHERLSGKPLGGSNSPPLTFSCSAKGRRRV